MNVSICASRGLVASITPSLNMTEAASLRQSVTSLMRLALGTAGMARRAVLSQVNQELRDIIFQVFLFLFVLCSFHYSQFLPLSWLSIERFLSETQLKIFCLKVDLRESLLWTSTRIPCI